MKRSAGTPEQKEASQGLGRSPPRRGEGIPVPGWRGQTYPGGGGGGGAPTQREVPTQHGVRTLTNREKWNAGGTTRRKVGDDFSRKLSDVHSDGQERIGNQVTKLNPEWPGA